MTLRTRSAVALAGAAIGAFALPLTASGAAGTTTYVDYDQNARTFPVGDPFCSFPVERIIDGRLWTRVTTTGGVNESHAWVSHFTYTLRNPANGKELTSHLGGTEDVTTYPDGTVTDEVRGNDLNFTVPGSGRLTGYAGHYRQVTLPDGTLDVQIQTHNEADTVFPAACAYLA